MKTTLMMATTINGLIAGPDDETDWIQDFELLNQVIAEFGVVVYGKRTYVECVKYDAFPYAQALNIIMTHDQNLLAQKFPNVLFTDVSPKEVVKSAEAQGFKRLLLIGGGHLNASFMKEKLIDEVVLDVHPQAMGQGIRLFEGDFDSASLRLQSVTQLPNDLVQIKYSVVR